MRTLKLLRFLVSGRGLWAIAAGLMLAASFPRLSIAGFAWIAPGMMLLGAVGRQGWGSFRMGYLAGLAHYLAALYWLLLIPVPLAWCWAKVLGWLALAAFMALYPATWVWLCWKCFPVRLSGEPQARPVQNWASQFLSTTWSERMTWCLFGAALWVALEMTIARLFGGYPWDLLGVSQYRIVPLIQIASHTGVYGVSFLVVWSSLSLVCAAAAIITKPAMRSAWVAQIIVPMAVVGAVYAAGYHKLLQPVEKRPEVTLALIQPSIPQTVIWDPAESAHRFDDLLKLSTQAMSTKPDVVVWPEAAVPKMVARDRETYLAVTDFARTNKVWMIIGSDDGDPLPGATTWKGGKFYNSSFLVSPAGELVARYKKRKLVIFGEYVPALLKIFTPVTDSFTPGEGPVMFRLPDLKIKVSTLICFEDIFPQLAREYVDDDTDFLVNLTNNGWFGEAAAQWQHAATAIFRAVENGVPLVRCSNNGLTCIVDAAGRMQQIFHTADGDVYGAGFMLARVPVLAPGETRAPTFYLAHGDWFGWGCVMLAAVRMLAAWMRRAEIVAVKEEGSN
jgi:apolipoprotein N-acyltransferase